MAIGVFVLIGGVVLMVIGGENIEDSGEWNPEKKSVFSGTSGTVTYDYSGEDMIVMVRDNVRCDEFSMSMTNDTIDNLLTIDCVEDGAHPIGWEDDPEGWYHMTTISYLDYNEGQYTIEANANYEIVPLWEVVGEEIGEAVGGFFQGAAGVMLLCCGDCDYAIMVLHAQKPSISDIIPKISLVRFRIVFMFLNPSITDWFLF